MLQEQPELGKLISSALAQYETSGELPAHLMWLLSVAPEMLDTSEASAITLSFTSQDISLTSPKESHPEGLYLIISRQHLAMS